MPPDHSASSYRPDGSWSCTRDHVTQPCGDCDGCRQVQAENLAAEDNPIPPGLLVSEDSSGGYAVPRQLAGRIRRRR